MDIQNLVPVDYSNQRVLLTAQVAEVYGTTPARIRDNFKHAKKQFKEGVHYFKVEGEELRAMREQAMSALNSYAPSPFPKGGNAIILYTEQGVARHCKILNTPQAWEMFDVLEKHYFNPATHVAPPVIAAVDFTALVERMDRLELLVQTLIEGFERQTAALNKQLSKADCADKLLTVADKLSDVDAKDKLLFHAANLINGKKIF